MRKKLLASALIMVLLSANFIEIAIAKTSDFTREKRNKLFSNVSIIDDNTTVDSKYDAVSIPVPYDNITICDYGTTNKKSLPKITGDSQEPDGSGAVQLDDNGKNAEDPKGYTSSWWVKVDTENDDEQWLYWNLTLDSDSSEGKEKTINDVATIIYKGGLEYKGKVYDIRLDIEEISAVLSHPDSSNYDCASPEIQFAVGKRDYQSGNLADIDTYTGEINPQVGVRPYKGSNQKANIKVKYYALDGDKAIPFAGVFGITDIDLNQGVYIEDFEVSKATAFMYPRNTENGIGIDRMYYNNLKNGAYIYYYYGSDANSAKAEDGGDRTEHADVYGLIDAKDSMDLTFTWDRLKAYSSIIFMNDVLKTADYKVEHYFENDNGEYEHNKIYDEFVSGKQVGDPVEADKLKNIPNGYAYNAEYTNNQTNSMGTKPANKGIVQSDGSLVLKLYYNKKAIPVTPTPVTPTPVTPTPVTPTPVTPTPVTPAPETGKYKVEHYLQQEDGSYKLELTEPEKTAKVGSEIKNKSREFPGYLENITHKDRVNSVKIIKNQTVTLKYFYDMVKKPKYRIDTEVINGTIDPDVTDIPEGKTEEIKYNPNDGFELKSITVDGVEVDTTKYPISYIFKDINANHKIKVVYEKKENPHTYRIDTEVINGDITPPIKEIVEGDTKTIIYTPNPGYVLKSVTVDGVEVDTNQYPSAYTFSNINQDHRIKVVYEKEEKPITPKVEEPQAPTILPKTGINNTIFIVILGAAVAVAIITGRRYFKIK